MVEIKRTKEGHMELQALRYAAVLASMNFGMAVNTYQIYLKKQGVSLDAEQELLKFLDESDLTKEDFAQDVRVILLAAKLSNELITSILWLNDKGLDIKCFKLETNKNGEQLYFNIQQVIPLIEAEEYQIRLKEKTYKEQINRMKKERMQSIISKLFSENKLLIGQEVFLNPMVINENINLHTVTAKIVNNKQKCLKISDNDQLYSFSSLRRYFALKYDLANINPD